MMTECAGLSAHPYLCENAVIMLIRNIDTLDGLVNSTRGVLNKIDWGPVQDNIESPIPLALYVQLFYNYIGRNSSETSAEYQGLVKIEPFSDYFYGKSNVIIQRAQFPIFLSWRVPSIKSRV